VVHSVRKQRQGGLRNASDEVKYIIFTEVPADKLQDVLNDQEQISKCDSMLLMYDNDRDHIDFIKDNIWHLPQLVPKVLVQSKYDLLQNPSETLIFGDDFAKNLGGLKMYK